MNWSQIKFDGKDLVKFAGFIFMFVTQYYLLKQEIHDNKTFDLADKKVINYRLDAIEGKLAILPKEIKIEGK